MSEIEEVLTYLSKRIIDYVKLAESGEGKVTKLLDPRQLQSQLQAEFPVSEKGQGFETFKKFTEFLLDNSVATWNPNFLEKLYAGTNPVGVASDLLLSILNTNSHVFTASPALTVIEKYISQKYAAVFGFNGPNAGGLTFPGGSYSNITSMHMARSIKFPDTKQEGNTKQLALFASEHCHYSVSKAAILLGLGSNSVYKVAVHVDGSLDVNELNRQIEKSIADKRVPFYINATAGTTVYGSFDPFEEIASVAQKHDLWLHIDGSWGANVVFSAKQSHKLRGSHLADSITVNPHKMLGVPCTCSFLLVPNTTTFLKANSMEAAYLFHGVDKSPSDNFDLAAGTMGCGRRADSLKFFMAWQWYGHQGFAERVDHAFEMTKYLGDLVEKSENLQLCCQNPPPCLQTCFWFAPQGKLASVQETTRYTRAISTEMQRQSKFLVDYSPDPAKGEFFRVVLNSPAVTKEILDDLVNTIEQIGNDLVK